MQGDKDMTAYGFGVDFAQALDNFGIGFAAEDFGKRLHYVCFDRHAQAEIAEGGEQLSSSLASGAAWTAVP